MKNAVFEQADRRAMDGAQNKTRKCLTFLEVVRETPN
jgi:hypothetical protein